jgi:acyl-coenzyme A synthetase/AMP-(fatty) acid ligase
MMLDYMALCKTWDPWRGIPTQFNLGHALTTGQVDAGHGDTPALLWENARHESSVFTYRQLDALSRRFASSLGRMGVKKGDRVFLRLPNLPEFYIAALGISRIGGVFIPSSTQFRTHEVEYRLRDSGAVAAIATPELVEAVDQASGNCPNLRSVIVTDGWGSNRTTISRSYVSFGSMIDQGAESFQYEDTRSDDIGFIAYTSGTTADPKGVVHYQRYPIAYEGLVRYWHDYRPGDIVACPAEMGWLLPVASTFLYALAKGLSVVLYDAHGGRFDPERWCGLFKKYGITNFTAPPTIYRMLMAAAEGSRCFDFHTWRHAVSAGEPLPPDTLAAIQQHFGVLPRDGIGMTECMVYCFNSEGVDFKAGSCGLAGPGTVIELMDDEMKPVGPGEEGVLCVRRDSHPGMMKEYWNKPEQTAEVFRGDWFYSGDVLKRDEEDYFWFQGRNDDVMKVSGYRISPFEVESGLVSHPAVLEAAAVESPDPMRGLVVKAFIVLREGFSPCEALAAQIQEFVKSQMAPFKYPRKVEFVTSLPKTPSGKIRRRELRDKERDRLQHILPVS